jgi:hypothetical protein
MNTDSKRYVGLADREGLDNVIVHVIRNGVPDTAYDLPLHIEIREHSPTGFAWGYWGSGPAQLALAICYDYLCDMRGDKVVARAEALEIYQTFKERVIAKLEMNSNFVMTTNEVCRAVEQILSIRGPVRGAR